MKKVIKWVSIVVGTLIVLVIAAILIVPMVVDVEKYKPEIEKVVSEATGRPFTIGGELRLSLFPWAVLAFSDLHLGNPSGFEEKDFLSVKSFDVQVKLLPLISRDIQVKRFILEGPRIVLERSKDGRLSWEGIGKPSGEVSPETPKEKRRPREGLPIKALAVGEFAITGGSLVWIDHVKGERREVSDMTLRLEDVSKDRPIRLALSAQLDGHPLSLEGNVGPIGADLGKGAVPLDLNLKALKELEMTIKGKLVSAVSRPQFDLALQLFPFSPRRLVAALGQDFPMATADPEALNLVSLKARVKGDPQNITVSDGALDLDKSKLRFSVKVKDFSKPDVKFDLNLDQIDIDRYLPAPGDEKSAEEKKKSQAAAPEGKKTDYTTLRRLVLDGTIRVGELKAKGAKIQDIYLKVTGKNGRFHLDPLNLKLYEGDMSAKGSFDVRQDIPKSNMELRAKGIQAGPLLRDVLNKDFLEGVMKATVAIGMAGDDPDRIKSTLNGKGDFLFRDGVIKGIDLAGMVQNVKAAFGLAEKGGEGPRTDFSDFHVPFNIRNGVVNTPKTTLISPLIRVMAAGKANLVKESLDFRVEPKFVATLKGQGDTMQRAGLMVPVLVRGSFSSPSFRPDLKGMFQQKLQKAIAEPSELKKILQKPSEEKGETTSLEEKAKGLLKGLPFGR